MKYFVLFISAVTLLSFTGKAQTPGSGAPGQTARREYGKNIVSLIPAALQNECFAAGICYERFLDERDKFSLYIPITINTQKLAWHYREQYKTLTTGGLIGFKCYIPSSRGWVRYALGLSIGAYNNTRTYTKGYNPMGPAYDDTRKTNFIRAGLLFNNSINFTVSRKISLAMDMHLGIGQSQEPNEDNTVPMVLMMFKAGYRF